MLTKNFQADAMQYSKIKITFFIVMGILCAIQSAHAGSWKTYHIDSPYTSCETRVVTNGQAKFIKQCGIWYQTYRINNTNSTSHLNSDIKLHFIDGKSFSYHSKQFKRLYGVKEPVFKIKTQELQKVVKESIFTVETQTKPKQFLNVKTGNLADYINR